jgi:hypothetical protein
MSDNDQTLSDAVKALLEVEWLATATGNVPPPAGIPNEIHEAIKRSINSSSKSYRYVLPTQLLAKAVRPALDCRSIQANSGLVEAFDARSLCHEIIVPFDRQNHDVLGGSPEPYTNNPLRIPAIIASERSAQRNGRGFDDLRAVLDYVQEHGEVVTDVLRIVFLAIRDRLAVTRVIYPVPNRVSLAAAVGVVTAFGHARTGGNRLQAIAVALFRTIGGRFQIFDEVRSENINAADASTGSAADIECLRGETVVLAVEVKDRLLILRHVQDKLPAIREKGISELLFTVQGGVDVNDADAVRGIVAGQFATGQNIYVSEFSTFLETCLILLSEEGRRVLLKAIGEELDLRRADLHHRQAWRDLLASI